MTDDLQTLADQATRHLNAGRFADAATAFEAVLARQPDLPDLWYNLGYAQRRARRFEDALLSYREALDRGAAKPEQIHLNRAVIFAQDLGRPDEAETDLKAALALAPSYISALINLGGLHEDRGQRDEAKAAYQRALDASPRNILALSRLAVLSKIDSAGHPLIAQMRAHIADPNTKAAERADLGFALGQVLDGAGAYDEAFEAYQAANTASRTSRGPNGAAYNRPVQEELTGRIIKTFAAPGESGSGGPGQAPLFICGMFRSGSTLAERILARHSRVTAGGELGLIPAMIAAEFKHYPESASAADAATFDRLRASHLAELDTLFPEADIVTDKRPENFRHIGLIKRLFPQAKIVDTRRDPMDNCLSVWFAHLGPKQPYALDLATIAHWYGEYRRLMAHWKALWPADILELDYDALVADPEPNIRALVDFCGLDWEDACLEPHEATDTVRTASAWQVREPLYRSSSGRWRNYEGHLDALKEALPTTE